jgi:hypothetical protein
MKKKLIIIIILISLVSIFIYFGRTAIISTTGKTIPEKLAKKIPENTKTWIKNTFFTSQVLRLDIRNQNQEIEQLRLRENAKNKQVIEKFKKIPFEPLSEFATNNDKYRLKLYQTKFLSNGKNDFAVASGYIGIFEENLLFVTGDALMFKIKLSDLNDPEKGFDADLINTNLKDIIKTAGFFKKSYFGIKDLTIIDDKIFLSFSNEIKENCFNTGILIAALDLNNLNFEKHSLSESDCAPVGDMDNALQGGRIVKLSDKEIFFTHGDWFQGSSAQDKKSIFGKILKYNFINRSYEMVSYGHRNPQGLYYLEDKNILIETEHGPIGGDEINIIDLNNKIVEKNYGWPIASYGKGTQQNAGVLSSGTKNYKGHDGYIEPIKYYVPSIGISEILRIPNKFFKNENLSENLFIATLGTKISEGDLSLHHLQINENYNKVISSNIIHIQERIRDMVYSEKLNSLILFIESDRMYKGGPSIAIFEYK